MNLFAFLLSKAIMQVNSCYRTAELMHFMANVVSRDSYEGLDKRFYKIEEPYAIGDRLPEIIREVDIVERKTKLVLEKDSSKQIKNIRIKNFTTNKARFYDDFYDELLYEIVRNAAKYGTLQECFLKIETDRNLIPDSELKLKNSDVAVIITNECKSKPDLGRLKIQPQMIGQWLEFGDRL